METHHLFKDGPTFKRATPQRSVSKGKCDLTCFALLNGQFTFLHCASIFTRPENYISNLPCSFLLQTRLNSTINIMAEN